MKNKFDFHAHACKIEVSQVCNSAEQHTHSCYTTTAIQEHTVYVKIFVYKILDISENHIN